MATGDREATAFPPHYGRHGTPMLRKTAPISIDEHRCVRYLSAHRTPNVIQRKVTRYKGDVSLRRCPAVKWAVRLQAARWRFAPGRPFLPFQPRQDGAARPSRTHLPSGQTLGIRWQRTPRCRWASAVQLSGQSSCRAASTYRAIAARRLFVSGHWRRAYARRT